VDLDSSKEFASGNRLGLRQWPVSQLAGLLKSCATDCKTMKTVMAVEESFPASRERSLNTGVDTVVIEELKYNPSHEWVGVVEEDGQKIGIVGISGFALEQLTDLVYMELPSVGDQVVFGEQFGEVESVKAVSPLYSPVTGEVIAVNEEVKSQLDSLGNDPYGSGWLIKVRLANTADLASLLDHAAYVSQCAH